MDSENCFHCGNEIIKKDEVIFDDKSFCCNGCKTVYEIFSQNDMTCYYDFQSAPGATPQDIQGKYTFLDNDDIVSKYLQMMSSLTYGEKLAVVEKLISGIMKIQ